MKKWLIIVIMVGALVGFLVIYLGPSPSPECPMFRQSNGEIGFYCTFWNYNFQFILPSIIGAIMGGIIGAIMGIIIGWLYGKIKNRDKSRRL